MNLKDYIKQIIAERELQAKMDERKISEEDIKEFVYSEAKKQAKNNCACIDNETVGNWIVHYVEDAYNEDKEKGRANTEEQPKENKKVEENKKEEPKPIVYSSAIKKAKATGKEQQQSLFDFSYEEQPKETEEVKENEKNN